MVQLPVSQLREQELHKLLTALEIEVLNLAECIVSPGYALELGSASVPGIHYCLSGSGRIVIGKTTFELAPHTLIVVPAVRSFRLENGVRSHLRVVDGTLQRSREVEKGTVPRFSAGSEPDALLLICGFFRAGFGSTVELFGTASAPIAEHFGVSDRLDTKIKEALAELVDQEMGFGAMSSALLKTVIIALLRRELSSTDEWIEHFALLRDPNIMRAFAEMVAQPGGSHSVESLARTACLSRSAFMNRFSTILGRTPMDVLRELRMRQAALQLETENVCVDKVARDAGYRSRSSFTRAFIKTFGRDWRQSHETRNP